MYKHERYIVCFLTQSLCKMFPCKLPSFLAFSLASLSDTRASVAQDITIQLLLSRGYHGYTFVLFLPIKDSTA